MKEFGDLFYLMLLFIETLILMILPWRHVGDAYFYIGLIVTMIATAGAMEEGYYHESPFGDEPYWVSTNRVAERWLKEFINLFKNWNKRVKDPDSIIDVSISETAHVSHDVTIKDIDVEFHEIEEGIYTVPMKIGNKTFFISMTDVRKLWATSEEGETLRKKIRNANDKSLNP